MSQGRPLRGEGKEIVMAKYVVAAVLVVLLVGVGICLSRRK